MGLFLGVTWRVDVFSIGDWKWFMEITTTTSFDPLEFQVSGVLNAIDTS
jgi:hypothetical protein